MPELKQIEVAAQNVQNGDHLVYSNKDGFVASKKVGGKWTEIREASGRLLCRVENSDRLTVGRMMPTEAEEAAQQARYLEQRAERFLEDLEASYPAAVKAVQENIGRGLSITSSMMEALATGEVELSYAKRLRSGLERHGQKTLVDLIALLRDELENQILESNGVARWSGGFSFHNAMEQAEFDTKKKIYRSIKFWTF
jgi:hypothetical protein